MPFIDAMSASKAELAIEDAWGHLKPKGRKVYKGHMIFCCGEYGDIISISSEFEGLPGSPWFFQDQQDFLHECEMEEGCIYRFDGMYTRKREGHESFVGTVKKIEI